MIWRLWHGLCCVLAAAKELNYQHVFLPDPKVVLEGTRPEGAKENIALLEANKQWVNDRTGKSVTKKMINVPNTMPVTPHGVYKYIDDSPYCWVMFAYDSDEDVASEIYGLAVKLSEYFYERCSVGMLDMAYPSNKFTFGYLIEDMPMLLVKKAGRQNKMLQSYIEQDSFVLRDRKEWGERILTDDLEDDIDQELEKIVKKYYEPISDFVKLTSLHVQWYAQHSKAKEEAQAVIKEHVSALAQEYQKDGEQIDKYQFYEKISETADELKALLQEQEMSTSPRPIRNLFEGSFDGLKNGKYKGEL